MNKVGKSFALCASVATFMHGSAEKIYKSHILRTATITRTSSTRSLTVQAQNLYAESFQKTSLEWCKIPPISEILWDDLVGSPTFHKISRFKISVLLHVLRKNGQGVMRSCLCCTCRAKLTFTSHAFPHGITHLRCATPGETAITSSRPNQPMPRKAAQLNHIDRCDRTLHTLPATPSPPPRSLEN